MTATAPLPGFSRSCSFCDRDLWEVRRYVSAGNAAICDTCARTAAETIEASAADAESEILLPPRVFGAPAAEGAVTAIVDAFDAVFGESSTPEGRAHALEDSEDLAEYFNEAGRRFPTRPSAVRIGALRFVGDSLADVRFSVSLLAGGAFPFEGQAIRHGDRWFVTCGTAIDVLARGGIHVPPRPR